MTGLQLQQSLRLSYWLSATFVVAGAGAFAVWEGWRAALAFALGGLLSLANFWSFERLSLGIAPEEGRPPQSRSTALFVIRYAVLFAVVYATVNALGLDPLPIFAGLFVSTVAVLGLSVLEILRGLFRKASSSS